GLTAGIIAMIELSGGIGGREQGMRSWCNSVQRHAGPRHALKNGIDPTLRAVAGRRAVAWSMLCTTSADELDDANWTSKAGTTTIFGEQEACLRDAGINDS
ncbi:MAG: hypothetical protein ACR2PI_12340, partial [Hyphomicrobiaceae bacterium]